MEANIIWWKYHGLLWMVGHRLSSYFATSCKPQFYVITSLYWSKCLFRLQVICLDLHCICAYAVPTCWRQLTCTHFAFSTCHILLPAVKTTHTAQPARRIAACLLLHHWASLLVPLSMCRPVFVNKCFIWWAWLPARWPVLSLWNHTMHLRHSYYAVQCVQLGRVLGLARLEFRFLVRWLSWVGWPWWPLKKGRETFVVLVSILCCCIDTDYWSLLLVWMPTQ